MKILIVSMNYAPELTGIGKYSSEMAEWLAMEGHDVTVICAPPYYPSWKISAPYAAWRYKKERLNGVKVIRCPIWVPKSVTGLKRIIHLVSFAISSIPILLLQIFRNNNVVFTVEPSFLNSFAALFVAKLSRAKSILHIQDFEIDVAFELGIVKNKMLKRVLLKIEKTTMSFFDVVSTSSEAMVDLLHEKGVPTGKAYLFPNWVDVDQIHPLKNKNQYRSNFNIDNETCVALYSGNMGEKQGLEIIIESANCLVNSKILFLMCGSGVALKRLKESSKHMPNVLWIDLQPLDRLNMLLNMADIHLLPQLAGASDLLMPSKLNGMLSSAVPIVATAYKNTQIEKVVSDCGIVTEPENVKEFSDAIFKLSIDAPFRKELGKNARYYAEKNLKYDVIMRNFEHKILDMVR